MNLNTLWIIIAVLGVASLYNACAGGKDTAIAQEKIKQGALLLDVRTADEFASGAYPGAQNIPLQELQSRLAEVGPKDKPVVVYCRSGNRSAAARKILLKAGYTDVTNAGGLADLQK